MRRSANLGVCLIALMIALSMSSLLSAQEEEDDDGRGWWTQASVQEALKLTPEQLARISVLEEQKRTKVQEARRSVAVAMRQMISALDAESVPEATVATRRAELEAAWQHHLDVTLDHWRALRQQLTEEQWKALPNVAPQAMRLGMLRIRSRQTVQVGN